ncbi:AIPR family protein [Streptomyces albidoflavus]|uniref:AIPR family protein n=1 Tax=Streptomyces TaxID=1883 RepID=UPI00225AFA47|nr:AIPR family protein [Streptomyces sp. FT1]MCX5462199.1 AIPR family protein [Streptomyces sp. FT1]
MGLLQLTQIQRRIEETTFPFADVSDLAAHEPAHVFVNHLSRALAAFVIAKRGGLGWEAASATVTDGSGDNGIDAIALNLEGDRLLIVQSKWSQDGRGSLALDDFIKFREGISDLVQLRWQRFNEKVRVRQKEIEDALLDPKMQIEIIVAHSGVSDCSSDIRDRMETFLDETFNTPDEVASFNYLGQSGIHKLLLDDHQLPKIDLLVELADWGQFAGEPVAYYGQVSAAQVAGWHREHGTTLFSKNVRVVLNNSEVNETLIDTLRERPAEFWYYNNGVTILCEKISKAPAYGADRRIGAFTFSGADVVNGAQTVGSIAKAERLGIDLTEAKVTVRFISLEDAQSEFANSVTRATNTQNRITGRDFLALDPEQSRIKNEFLLEGLTYIYKSGEADPAPETGCSVTEATIALSCANPDVNLSTQAKREISRLWDTGDRGAYKKLFNPSVTYQRIWRSVQVVRQVEELLGDTLPSLEGRARGMAVHGNRFILHLVFRQLETKNIDDPRFDWSSQARRVPGLVEKTLTVVTEVADADYPGYPASLFKNATKCSGLARNALSKLRDS